MTRLYLNLAIVELSMIKRIIFLFVLFPSIAFAGAASIGGVAVGDIDSIGGVAIEDIDTFGGVSVVGGGGTCQAGTYSLAWNGEYSGDTDKACLNSGASTADATDASAGVIDAGGAINGSYGALINAVGEHVRWAAESSTIDNAGTVKMYVTLPSSLTHTRPLFEIYLDSSNSILGYYHLATDSFYLRHESGSVSDYHFASAPAENSTVLVSFTWKDTATETMCVRVGTDAWDTGTHCDAAVNLGAGFTPASYAIGEDQDYYITSNLTTGTNAWKIDDVYFINGYQQ